MQLMPTPKKDRIKAEITRLIRQGQLSNVARVVRLAYIDNTMTLEEIETTIKAAKGH